MRLVSVQLSEYKCIRKTCQFDVEDITCLVGKNESGKTAILEALYRQNPIVPEHGTFNVDDDYPRIDVEDYRLEVADDRREPAIVTRTVYSLNREDLKQIEADFPGVLAQPELVLSKGYANELYAELTINEEVVVEGLLKGAGLSAQALKALVRCSTVESLAKELKTYDKEAAAAKLQEAIEPILSRGLLQHLYEKYLEHRVPKFMYFDDFYQMKGHVNIQALIERRQNGALLDSDYPLLGLIDLARLNLEEISHPGRALERSNRLEGASNHLTRSIMKYWSQNPDLELRFDIRPGLANDPEGMREGTNLWGHVYNAKQRVTTLLGRRSRGFVWFFSFLAWFSQQKRKNIPMILLLDEPSLFLHGSAQKDLLKYLEDECSDGLQVIYSTQSPYLVDAAHLERVRVVEDRTTSIRDFSPDSRDGTEVFSDIGRASEESILPLKDAMTASLSRNLLSSPFLLLVEEFQDLLYLQILSGLLTANGKQGLDPRWTVTPMGGAKNLALFVPLMKSESRNDLAVLRSGPPEGQTSGAASGIYTYAAFTDGESAGIEDMFDADTYLHLVNSAYADVLNRPLTRKQLRGSERRIVDRVSDALDPILEDSGSRFNPIKPAQYLSRHTIEMRERIRPETLQRFARLFAGLNSKIPE